MITRLSPAMMISIRLASDLATLSQQGNRVKE